MEVDYHKTNLVQPKKLIPFGSAQRDRWRPFSDVSSYGCD